MNRARTSFLVLLVAAFFGQQTSAQSLTFSLFERYLESLRDEAGIPGLSVAIVQNGQLAWERGLGRQDVDANIFASPDTPYALGDLSQIFGGTLLLKKCLDESHGELTDPVARWAPFAERATTLAHLLAHAAPAGGFRYSPERFSALTEVVSECGRREYAQVLVNDVFDRLGMASSVPGDALATPTAADRALFDEARLSRYAAIVRRMAVPYRVPSRGRVIRAEAAPRAVDAAAGVVTTVRDLARFDAALDAGALLARGTRELAWTQATIGGATLPTGLGWFVQQYRGEPLIWHAGMVRDSYSALVLKAPRRGMTLILLANSDGLTAPFSLENGDITSSVFARLFLRLFVA